MNDTYTADTNATTTQIDGLANVVPHPASATSIAMTGVASPPQTPAD